MPKIITIDGPAGTGKTSAARLLAKILPDGFQYLDTGMAYRAIAVRATQIGDGRNLGDFKKNPDTLVAYLGNVKIMDDTSGTPAAFIGSTAIDDGKLRNHEISDLASKFSTYPAIRQAANKILRDYAGDRNIIAEGRDTGSALFPDADVKFYLYADLDVRAARRLSQDKAGLNLMPMYIRGLLSRDRRDSTREADPLKIPGDAVYLDTSAMSEQAVIKAMHDVVCGKLYPETLRVI